MAALKKKKKKNILRTSQCQKRQKFKNSQPQRKFIGSYKKKSVVVNLLMFLIQNLIMVVFSLILIVSLKSRMFQVL